jgi:hypothetical protein
VSESKLTLLLFEQISFLSRLLPLLDDVNVPRDEKLGGHPSFLSARQVLAWVPEIAVAITKKEMIIFLI